MYFLEAFLILAYADSVCLWAGLYDKAPTFDQTLFNKDDDRLFLGGPTGIHQGDDSSIQD